jgi:hypothetical protein
MPGTVPWLPPSIIGGQFTFTWPTLAGQAYQVEYKNNLTAANWMPLGDPLPGTGAPLIFTNNPAASEQGYYRLKILP